MRIIPSSTTNFRQGELDTPHLTLVAQTVLADDLQFGVTIERGRLGNGQHDISRSTLPLSGRGVLTDEPTRKLQTSQYRSTTIF
jgi:hypothetical protein